MNALPLIARELRIESRRPWNYWSRMAAGGFVTVSFALDAMSKRWGMISGLQLFNEASFVVVALIWLVAPLLTADCLSGEKREGTLGLLFLTPLRPSDIVIGKSLVHALRASSVLLAGIPVLALSVPLGGVSAIAVAVMLMHYLGALALALAAGLVASAWSRDWLRSVILTVCLTLLFGTIYYRGTRYMALGGSIWAAAILFGSTLLFLSGAVVLAAQRIRVSWQEGPPSKWALWWLRTFCSPLFWKELLRRTSRESLERNPIGWLHERTATARVSKWLWCCGAAVISSLAVSTSGDTPMFLAFELALALAMAFAGASSLRRERQNGVMELLLVAPLKLGQIIQGRLWAVVKQFAPAVGMIVVLLFGYLIWTGTDVTNADSFILAHCFLLVTSLATLPSLGLYFSLHVRRFLTAWLLTCLVGLALPYYGAILVFSAQGPSVFGIMAILQVAVSVFAIKHLRNGLERSSFALQNA